MRGQRQIVRRLPSLNHLFKNKNNIFVPKNPAKCDINDWEFRGLNALSNFLTILLQYWTKANVPVLNKLNALAINLYRFLGIYFV